MQDNDLQSRSASYLTVIIWSMVFILLATFYNLGVSCLRYESQARDIIIVSAAGFSIILNVIFASQSPALRENASLSWITTSLVLTLGIALFPGPAGICLISILAILWIVTIGRCSAAASMAGMTILSCCGYLLWIPLLMPLAANIVLPFDIKLVASIFDLEGNLEELTLFGGHKVRASWENSSLSNLSSATVLWLATVGLARGRVILVDIMSLLTLLICLFTLNTMKLGLLAQTPHSYEFWSSGHGSALFGGLTILISVAIPLFGARLVTGKEAR